MNLKHTPTDAATSSLEVAADEAGQRLDKWLAARLPELSRSRIQQLIEQGMVRGDVAADASVKTRAGQRWQVTIPPTKPSHIEAQELPLTIVFEDKHLLVIDKPPGMTVHPAPGNADGTLVNALLAHCGNSLSGIGGVARPGIVHRIDKDTSGLLVVAKHDAAHQALSAQLADHTLGRTYLALVWGSPKQASGTYRSAIGRSPSNRKKMAVLKSGGKMAVTHWRVLERLTPTGAKPVLASLMEFQLETGRTHQIRVHSSHAGHALLGDPVYGGASAKNRLSHLKIDPQLKSELTTFPRQALHAAELHLQHPVSGERMIFSSPLPDDMMLLLKLLRAC